MIKLNQRQKEILRNYINKSIHDYHKGIIHLEDELIKNFKNIQYAIEENKEINKYCLDYVLGDMKKSFVNEGYERQTYMADFEDLK